MREARKAAAKAVTNIGMERSVSDTPSCLSYKPSRTTSTKETIFSLF